MSAFFISLPLAPILLPQWVHPSTSQFTASPSPLSQLFYSISNIKGPLIHFPNKQTLSLSLSSSSVSPAPPLSIFILSPLHPGTHSNTHRETHTCTDRDRERMSAQQLSTSWLNRVFHLHEDRRRIESERPASTAGVLLADLVAHCATALFTSPPLCTYCAPCPGVWAAVYLLLAVSLCLCVCSHWGVRWGHSTAAYYH